MLTVLCMFRAIHEQGREVWPHSQVNLVTITTKTSHENINSFLEGKGPFLKNRN